MTRPASTCTLFAESVEQERSAKPFLKWVGGKRQLLPQLRRLVPQHFGRYHEPFLGSGALFFDLWNRDRIGAARLTDTNVDLIGCYQAVQREPGRLVDHLTELARRHALDPSGQYYRVRDGVFNPARRCWREEGRGLDEYPIDIAAMLIYLNRTGFNGLFRLNAKGDFNVPAGRYTNPRICDPATVHAVARALRAPGVAIAHEPYDSVLSKATSGDLVYFDPPYAPVSGTARFTSYTARGFGDEDQRRLQEVAITLARCGVHVILSNSTAPLIGELYEHSPEAAAAGLHACRVPARRAINSDPAGRGDVMEYMVSTSPRRPDG